jgi:acyl carrier protein
MTDLELEVARLIVDVLKLDDLAPEAIDPVQDLFADEGLGLDSIDALEIGVAVQKKYGIDIKNADDQAMRDHFRSIGSLAQMVETSR